LVGFARRHGLALNARLPPTPTIETCQSNEDARDEPRTILPQPTFDTLPLFFFVVEVINHGAVSLDILRL
jgi:hypothetical protein